MGIFESIKKAMAGTTEADKITVVTEEPAPEPAGAEQSEPEPTLAAEPAAAAAEQDSYTVQSGDTLWSIADAVYGDGSKYARIFDANTAVLESPERIFPGQKLLIPDLEDN